MPYPIKTCIKCGEEFELRPDKPGFANRCWDCSVNDEPDAAGGGKTAADALDSTSEINAERRKAIRDLLYRKDS